MRTKSTVAQAITNYLKKNSNVTASDLVGNLNKPSNQVYTTIWKMVKNGTLAKSESGVLRFAKAPAMTALKPDATVTVNASSGGAIGSGTKRKATLFEMKLASKLNKAEEEIAVLRRDLTQMSVNYYDALAVIKYLESKAKA